MYLSFLQVAYFISRVCLSSFLGPGRSDEQRRSVGRAGIGSHICLGNAKSVGTVRERKKQQIYVDIPLPVIWFFRGVAARGIARQIIAESSHVEEFFHRIGMACCEQFLNANLTT